MPFSQSFLVVDVDPDGLSLLSRTLARKFPGAKLHECTDVDACVNFVRSEPLDSIIVHRTVGTSGEDTVRMLRQANPVVPIVMVSGIDRRDSAIEAGATAFLHYDKWLLLGQTIAELINAPGSRNPWTNDGST
jgi:DNA-binding response OmpR family regulator